MNGTDKIFADYFMNFGQYNLCSSEKEYCLILRTSGGNFSETFTKDEQPDVSDMFPSEVLDLIEARLKSYWISTSRDEALARMAEWRKSANLFDMAWLDAKIERLSQSMGKLQKRKASLQCEIDDAQVTA